MTLSEGEIRDALDEAVHIAKGAAELVTKGFRTGADVRKKGRIDLVTEWDLRSEELIRRALGRAFPDHGVVGEEGDKVVRALTWYVDPLDGTTNFAHGHPFFSVSIALYAGAEPLVGVVAAPALHVVWQAGRGLGALRNDARCAVTPCAKLDDALCATGFPYDRQTNPDDNLREYRAFLKRTQGIRRCGSAAIDLALTGDGTYDVYWEQRLQPWDLAAGACIVREAGGTLTDYRGGAADVRTGELVATNGHLHEQTLALISRARAELG
jgi:myo-inositol-1(or 4)-monophosphatase